MSFPQNDNIKYICKKPKTPTLYITAKINVQTTGPVSFPVRYDPLGMQVISGRDILVALYFMSNVKK